MNLWCQLIGQFTVHYGNRAYTGRNIGSRKARTLMAFLAVERGRLTSVDRIVEVLWGDTPPRHPAANVSTLVSRLRSDFGRTVVAGGRLGYRLNDAVRTDLGDATVMVAQAQERLAAGEPSRALLYAVRALGLLGDRAYGGARAGVGEGCDVLADQPDALWTEATRTLHRDLLRRTRHAAATAAFDTGDDAMAKRTAEAAVRADPLDEAACRVLMRAHYTANEPGRALLAYERLRLALATELGCDPAQATRELHLEILRQDPAETVEGLRHRKDAASGVPRRVA